MSVLFFCIGAAKAGTSWLFQQLSRHPECHFRSIKELHYFDAVEHGRLDKELRKHRDLQAQMLDRLATAGTVPDREQASRLADRGAWIDVLERGVEDENAYLSYLNAGSGDARVIGDMTPAYALLSQARLARLARLAPDVRILFLMRDPVERLWSHVRMIAARRAVDGGLTADRCAHILNRTLAGEETQITARSDYAATLKNLFAAVAPGKVLVQVFEEMIQGDGFARICDFLGLRRAAPDLVPVHRGEILAMSPTQRDAAARWLAPQYAAAEAVLGHRPAAWAKGEF